MTEEQRRVRDDSDELLTAVDELRQLEQSKRGEAMSTPPFHALADEVEHKARRIFEIAAQENVDSEEVEFNGRTTDQTPPDHGDARASR